MPAVAGSWLTAASNTRGSAAAAGTIRPRSDGCRVAVEQPVGEQVVPPGDPPPRRARSAAGRRATHRGHRRPRLREPDRDALAGQRVDVARGVPDQQHPAATRAGERCRSGPAPRTRDRGGRRSRGAQRGERGQQVVEAARARR